MSSLKVITATAVILMSTSVLADIRVADTHNGAWITVTENGAPAANASVSVANVPQQKQSYQTDENGRVFIPLTLENSRSVKYKATTETGKKSSRFAFHSTNK
ncbi:hypothetical protein C9J48_05410 [Photobacterium profundum]|jgi:5-hydroxyisourate hydrolase-like protein (transthyretin family)|uniref:Uncharacterized protein n=3 Tax=Photobacterium TaxID=657 RepID=A0A2T3J8I8_9GAMM|nr:MULTISPECIES: hypothetical protein [Photobacterium]EAS44310.1 hypothetical protein P3TCK_06242 [Photobacterium profundum 3TCK]PSU45103.1 hypothetical protein C9J12_24380 [Photobacterium frigidiphilum]PSV46328.1 hypothetical protein C9J47_15900 [Photobacterium indicum]PSV62933.1 hypothetical protein C9J48_05410 [Photobacterium profundum]